MILLLDANLLLALFLETHVHHERADIWFSNLKGKFASCPVTQGALLRLHMQFAADSTSKGAWQVLTEVTSHPNHVFWKDSFSYTEIAPHYIQGHRQIIDAWLVELAKRNHGKIATFDKGLIANYPRYTLAIPS